MNGNNPGREAVLGIDIGGTKVLVGLVSRGGEILCSERRPVVWGEDRALFDAICEAADSLLAAAGDAVRVLAVGIGVKGHVQDNRLISSSVLGGAVSYDFCGMLREHFHLPVYADNDVNAATVAEAILGAGRDTNFFVYVNIGTGSALGIYDQGRLVRGRVNYSGEIGYTVCRLPQEDRLFCLEDVASGKGLSDETRRLAPAYPGSALALRAQRTVQNLSAIEIFDAWRAGDALAQEVVGRAVEVLAVSVINFECVLGSGLFIFGGGVISEPAFFDQVCARVQAIRAQLHLQLPLELRVSALGAANVGLLGAACVAFSAM
ncbi:MAG: ROK family protein [Candidatus Ventricola sp.]